MHGATISGANPEDLFPLLIEQVKSLLDGERDLIANTANVASAVYHALNDRGNGKTYNWVGFYFMRGGELVLGPFMGKPACIRIKVGRGVCGAAVQTKTTQLVEDVHAFKDHIACDSASQSEVVIPIFDAAKENVLAVFDLDCADLDGFDKADQSHLEEIARVLETGCDWSAL